MSAPARPGNNRIVWNGRAGKPAAKPGRYALVLQVAGTDGQPRQASAPLTIRARR